jgi:hypothetical protein
MRTALLTLALAAAASAGAQQQAQKVRKDAPATAVDSQPRLVPNPRLRPRPARPHPRRPPPPGGRLRVPADPADTTRPRPAGSPPGAA